ncbi:sperm-associated antigen 6-like [Cololabis saira]|uniref:sperm-associated antigen 6-like n=1 Tax=Cololabis saira TaxID=129043 RepID=UPI002AD54713|nr:sperm-associated antigen 6-like [Cololabis saira]
MKAKGIAQTCQMEVFSALINISQHSASLAEKVVEAEIFPAAVDRLRDRDEDVRMNVAHAGGGETLVGAVADHCEL